MIDEDDLTEAETLGVLDSGDQASDDAISALVALGYKSAEASKVVKRVDADCKNREMLIREALQSL